MFRRSNTGDESNFNLELYTFRTASKFAFVYSYASCVFAKANRCFFILWIMERRQKFGECVYGVSEKTSILVVDRKGGKSGD